MSVDSVECFLRVIRVEGIDSIEWEKSFGSEKPKLYVRVQLGKATAKTREIENTTDSWDELLILKLTQTSQDISIKLFHNPRFGFDDVLGSINIHPSVLSSKCADGSFPLSLDAGNKNIGSLTLHVHSLDLPKLLSGVENDVNTAVKAVLKLAPTTEALDAVGQGVSVMSAGKDISEPLMEIVTKLTVFANFMDKVAKIHPYLDTTWQIAAAVGKAIMHQKETDEKLIKLTKKMEDAYKLVTATKGLTNKARGLKVKIDEFLRKTVECCHFVLEYTRHGFRGRMLQMTRPTIDEFAECFNQLKEGLDSYVGLHIASVVEGTLETVTKTSKKVDIMYLKKILEPSSMKAFSRNACLPGTRSEVLDEIAYWIRSGTKQNVLWLRGVAGSGKSTIASTVVELCRKTSLLGAFLFYNRDTSSLDLRDAIFRTIAFQLAEFNPSIASHIEHAVENAAHITNATAKEQFVTLISGPLKASCDKIQIPVVIVIEALDEYGSEEERGSLMSLLKTSFAGLPPNFRFLLTSRPETDIIAALSNRKDSVYELILDSGSEENIRDVRRYIDHDMGLVFTYRGLDRPDGWDAKIDRLAKASEGLFIWASTAIKEVEKYPNPLEKFEYIVENSHLLKGLNRMYDSVLRNSGVILDGDKPSIQRFSQVLGLILVSKALLTDKMIDGILGFSPGNPSRLILSNLQSVLEFTPGQCIRISHTSFADYLFSTPCPNQCPKHQDKSDCLSGPWFIDIHSEKSFIAKRCFEIMKEMLHFNMCGLETSIQLNKDVPDLKERVKGNIPSHLMYACMHWTMHLGDIPYAADSMDSHNLMEELKSFAYNLLLYWLEVLSLLGRIETHEFLTVNSASRALTDGATWSEMHNASVSSFLKDASRLVSPKSSFAEILSRSTPHIYVSMIPLMKDESNVAAHYSQRMVSGVKVERIGLMRAPLWLKTLEGHTRSVVSVAISPDGRCVASGSSDNTIRIWDIQRGSEIYAPLEGHEKTVSAVAFSPDGRRIVSGSWDNTIRIWDAQSGQQVLGPLEGHSDAVSSVAFSPSGTLVASGSGDKTIRVWDTENGRTIRVIEGHSNCVRSVVFIPDGSRVVSCSDDKTIRVWSTETGSAVGERFVGHESLVSSLAVSPDGARVVSFGGWDRTVRVWDIESGKIINGSFSQPDFVKSAAFSPDGKRVVSGAGDVGYGTVVVWDVESGEIICGPLTGHTNSVNSVTFTPDGRHIVSGSDDNTVRIWDTSIGKVYLGPYVCHTSGILSVALSPEGTRVVSGSWYGTLGLWDVATCKLACAPFTGHKDAVNSVAFSRDGRRIVSGSSDTTVIIWNATNGKIIKGPLAGHTDRVFSVDFSPDGTRVTSASADKTIIIWNAINGKKISQFRLVHEYWISAVRFSPDGKLIASASYDNDIILWNAETGEVVSGPFKVEKPLFGIGALLAFSPDGKCIALQNGNNSITVHDVERGNIVYELLSTEKDLWVGRARFCSISFSPDGQYIVSGMSNGKVLLWNTSNSTTIPRSYEGHSGPVTCVAFSSAGSHVISCSYNNTVDNAIRIWNVIDPGDRYFENWTLYEQERTWPKQWEDWVSSPKGEHLLWIPKYMHNTLWRPQNTAVLNCDFSTKLDFKGATLGTHWQECYDPTIELAYPETEAAIPISKIMTWLNGLAGATSLSALIGDFIPANIRELRVFAFLRRLVDLSPPFYVQL